MRKFISVAALALLAACSTPPTISNNPVSTAAATVVPAGSTIAVGLQNAEWNLDQAINIGVLKQGDSADLCLHEALTQLGLEQGATPPAVQSFQPKVSDLISAGSVAYILAQQAKQIAGSGGVQVPTDCEALVGHFVLTGINAPANTAISVLPNVLP
ncbi:MAG: hypothetical protein KGJ90_00270 [Patescibacteria group bacterium]|nr:hypothetical protein [Patescibacteria group bacterium]